MWVKALFKSDPKINPNFALDMPTYTKTTAVHSFHPTVIHATYLHSDSDLDTQFQLRFDGTVTTSNLKGLLLHTLLDTGCHKTLLSKKVFDQNIKHFQNYYEIRFLEKHSITVGNGQHIYEHKMIALPLKIQDHYCDLFVYVYVYESMHSFDFINFIRILFHLQHRYMLSQ